MRQLLCFLYAVCVSVCKLICIFIIHDYCLCVEVVHDQVRRELTSACARRRSNEWFVCGACRRSGSHLGKYDECTRSDGICHRLRFSITYAYYGCTEDTHTITIAGYRICVGVNVIVYSCDSTQRPNISFNISTSTWQSECYRFISFSITKPKDNNEFLMPSKTIATLECDFK